MFGPPDGDIWLFETTTGGEFGPESELLFEVSTAINTNNIRKNKFTRNANGEIRDIIRISDYHNKKMLLINLNSLLYSPTRKIS